MDIKQTEKKYIVEGITYPTQKAIAEAYKENGVTLFGIQKAHARGKRGNDLIPEKKRKNYIAPKTIFKEKYVVGQFSFDSQTEACQKRGINYVTFRKRLNSGWSHEEALELKPRKRKKHPSRKDKKGKKIIVRNRIFPTMATAAKFYGIVPEVLYTRLRNHWTIEQALGLEQHLTSKVFSYNGKKFSSKKALAIELGLNPSALSNLSNDLSFEKSVDEILQKKANSKRGRRNEKFFSNNPELANLTGSIYIADLKHPDKKPVKGKAFYKVGITQDIDKRKEDLKFADKFWHLETTQLKASITEESTKKHFIEKRTDQFSPKDFDGKDEVFELTAEEVKEVKAFIRNKLSAQDFSKPNRVSLTKSKNN